MDRATEKHGLSTDGRGLRSANALVRWLAETLSKGDQSVPGGLQPLDDIGENLMSRGFCVKNPIS